jgi:phage gp29-like protein
MADLPKTPLFNAIATIRDGRDVTRGWVDNLLLVPQDKVLSGRGWDYTVYEELLRDDQVSAVLQQRQLALTSREMIVEPASDRLADRKAAEWLEAELKRVSWDRVTRKMLFGVFYGFAVAEMIWQRPAERKDGLIGIEAIKVKKQRRFRFHAEDGLRLLTTANPMGETLPPAKFWTFTCGGDNDDDPYGLGLASALYWPVFFKRNGLKFWLIWLEKFGFPTIKALADPTSDEERDKILAAMSALQRDSAILLPKSVELELLEAGRSGVGDFEALRKAMDAAIAKIILSQTMTTEDGSSEAQANVHERVKDSIVESDADLICDSFNRGPVTWLTNWNFPNAAPPRVWRRLDAAPDLNAMAARDKTLFEMGFRPTLDRVIETYGEGYEDIRQPPVVPDPTLVQAQTGSAGAAATPPADPQAAQNAAPAFAEPGPPPQDAVDELTNQTLELTRPAFTDIRESIAAYLDGDGDWTELAAGLPPIRTDQLAAILGDAMTVAELQGRADALTPASS